MEDVKVDVTEFEVLVGGEGLAELEIVRISQGCVVGEIVQTVTQRVGFPADQGNLFVEDEDDLVDLTVILTEEMVGKVYHVHRTRRIAITVFYKEDRKVRHFSPSSRVQRVLDWAVGQDGFNIDSALAPEMELALHGQTAALPKNMHIGRYVHHPQDCLTLDLIRGVVPNG